MEDTDRTPLDNVVQDNFQLDETQTAEVITKVVNVTEELREQTEVVINDQAVVRRTEFEDLIRKNIQPVVEMEVDMCTRSEVECAIIKELDVTKIQSIEKVLIAVQETVTVALIYLLPDDTDMGLLDEAIQSFLTNDLTLNSINESILENDLLMHLIDRMSAARLKVSWEN